MIVKKEFIDNVKDNFGLNTYETKVWLALLSKGVASAGEVAGLSRVPRSRAYDVLESLEKKGFAIEKLGKPVKYFGVKPKIILEKLKNDVKKEAEERVSFLSRVREISEFEELEELYDKGIETVKKEDLSTSLRGKSNISVYLKNMVERAKEEVIICADSEDVSKKAKLFKQTIRILKESNIKTYFCLSGEEKMIKYLEKMLDTKILRVKLKIKFFIIDRKEILFYVSDPVNHDDTAIWLNSSFFSEAFATLFEKASK